MNADVIPKRARERSNKRILQQAFHEFSRASASLENSYRELQVEAKRLSRELASANAELQRNQKLKAMGEMAVELAHEIRNPLGSIDLFASLLSSELTSDVRLRQWADQIVTSVKFLNTIVTNMLTFSRSSVPQLQLLDITGLIHETLDFMEPVFQQRTVKVSRPGREPIYIEGDRQMLWQALINLMMNSLQAMPDRGELSLQVCESEGMLVIAIDDSGIGIAPKNMERIFDPFFTTNEKGTGLGLALVHQIIEKHGGAVTASSELGKGSRFTISIPVAAREVTC